MIGKKYSKASKVVTSGHNFDTNPLFRARFNPWTLLGEFLPENHGSFTKILLLKAGGS
jgi:hypothetical protein